MLHLKFENVDILVFIFLPICFGFSSHLHRRGALLHDGRTHKDNHHQNKEWHCSHQFCITDEYEKLELPPVTNGSTTVHVVITPHILEIFEVFG